MTTRLSSKLSVKVYNVPLVFDTQFGLFVRDRNLTGCLSRRSFRWRKPTRSPLHSRRSNTVTIYRVLPLFAELLDLADEQVAELSNPVQNILDHETARAQALLFAKRIRSGIDDYIAIREVPDSPGMIHLASGGWRLTLRARTSSETQRRAPGRSCLSSRSNRSCREPRPGSPSAGRATHSNKPSPIWTCPQWEKAGAGSATTPSP